jgi:outer membrane receptor protein involved in Fe transport
VDNRPSSIVIPTLVSFAARHLLFVIALAAVVATSAPTASAQSPTTLAPLVVTSARLPQPAATVPVRVDRFSTADLTTAPGATLDARLAASAAFSLFRRGDSSTTNPTAQGVSLRGLGPSGAGRTLVLLDGVPLNDPFGGWITWSRLAGQPLAAAEIVRGGGSGAWGNAALGGTVQLFTAPPTTAARELTLALGDRHHRRAELRVDQPTATTGTLRLTAAHHDTAGAVLRAPDRRGPIDRPFDLTVNTATLAWHHDRTSLTLNHAEEDRGNGTPLQRNHTTATAFVATTTGDAPALPGAPTWTATAYAQDQSFNSVFTGVTPDRTAETPVLDQFDVPATALGTSATLAWPHTTLGFDARHTRGETREAFLRVANTFTRERRAGGEQTFLGLFIAHTRALTPDLQLTANARADAWRNHAGFRRERARATGQPTRTDTYAATSGTEFNPSLGLAWSATPALTLRAAAYQAFRLPTLNEYYRPFRVSDIVTEANPALTPERLDGGELGLSYATPRAGLTLGAFAARLTDPVANVTLGFGPGQVPGVGFVPAGGIGRQRRNLGALRARGLELAVYSQIHDTLRLTADALYVDTTVSADAPAPPAPLESLVGRRPAQVPRLVLTAGLIWTPAPAWRLDLRARHTGEAYEDDLNQLPLAAATTLDLRLTHRLRPTGPELYLALDNALDAQVPTARDTLGPTNLAPPRHLRTGLTYTW